MQYFTNTNMSLVNGYRVKCQNYKRMAEREGEMRRREEKLGSWSQEKASRKAAIKKFKKRLKGGIAKIFRSITFFILHILYLQELYQRVKQPCQAQTLWTLLGLNNATKTTLVTLPPTQMILWMI